MSAEAEQELKQIGRELRADPDKVVLKLLLHLIADQGASNLQRSA